MPHTGAIRDRHVWAVRTEAPQSYALLPRRPRPPSSSPVLHPFEAAVPNAAVDLKSLIHNPGVIQLLAKVCWPGMHADHDHIITQDIALDPQLDAISNFRTSGGRKALPDLRFSILSVTAVGGLRLLNLGFRMFPFLAAFQTKRYRYLSSSQARGLRFWDPLIPDFGSPIESSEVHPGTREDLRFHTTIGDMAAQLTATAHSTGLSSIPSRAPASQASDCTSPLLPLSSALIPVFGSPEHGYRVVYLRTNQRFLPMQAARSLGKGW